MTLEDLTKHIPAQTLRIAQLINQKDCFSDLKDDWAAFRYSLWGNGLASLEVNRPLFDAAHSTRPVVEIPKTLPHIYHPDTPKILVRSEYEETEQAALLSNAENFDVFFVTGQPGIGKSIFLIWLLMRRLSLALPTALQVEPKKIILFHEGGTSRFRHRDSLSAYQRLWFDDPSSKIWVLVDLNPNLQIPAPIFRHRGPFFVVETAPPREQCFHWGDKVFSRCFYMKTWSLSEVLQIRPFIGLSHGGPYEEYAFKYLYDVYQASPRSLSLYAGNPADYEVRVAAQVPLMKPSDLQYALESPDLDSNSDLIMRIEPSPTSRSLPEKTFASPVVIKIFWEWHTKTQVSEIQHFYNLFNSGSDMYFYRRHFPATNFPARSPF